MGAVVNINLSEIKKLADKLNSFCLSGEQKESLLHDIGVEVREQTLDRFDFETDPDGNPWKKLVDATVKYKNKYFDGGILEREGHLKNTISFNVNGEESVLVGSPMEYAGFHQEGTRKLPARPFLGMGTDNIDDLQNLIDKFLRRNVR